MPKNIILVLLLSIVFIASLPVDKPGKIEVSIIDCRVNEELNHKALQLTDGTGATKKLAWTPSNNTFKKLSPGTYSIGFTSLLGRSEVATVDLYSGQTKKVSICVDKFTDDLELTFSYNILDSLSVGQKYKILFQSHGCFHNKQDSIVVSRDTNAFFIHKGNQHRKLTTYQLLKLREFELMLTNGRFGGGCTTLDLFSIWIDKEQSFTNFDGSCSWYGFSHLIEKLL